MTQQMNLQKGLVGHWTMDDRDTSGGTLYDRSPYDNHATLKNSPNTSVSGQVSKSFKFDGSNSYLSVSNSSSLKSPSRTGELTVCAFVYPDTTNQTDSEGTIIQRNPYYFQVENSSTGGKVKMFVYNDTDSGKFVDSVSSLNDNTWQHVAATESSGTRKIYINGLLDNDESVDSSISEGEGDPLGIGYQIDIDDRYYKGRIDDARIYNRALSEEEINQLYQMRNQQNLYI